MTILGIYLLGAAVFGGLTLLLEKMQSEPSDVASVLLIAFGWPVVGSVLLWNALREAWAKAGGQS